MVFLVVSCCGMGVWLAGCAEILNISDEVELVNWSAMMLDVSGILELGVCSLSAMASNELELDVDTATVIISGNVELGAGSTKVLDEIELGVCSATLANASVVIKLGVCSLMMVASVELELGAGAATVIASVEVKLGACWAKVFDVVDT